MGQELHIERKVVAFHLAELEKVELVEAKYALNQDKRPVAVEYYKITPKGNYIYQHVVAIASKSTRPLILALNIKNKYRKSPK